MEGVVFLKQGGIVCQLPQFFNHSLQQKKGRRDRSHVFTLHTLMRTKTVDHRSSTAEPAYDRGLAKPARRELCCHAITPPVAAKSYRKKETHISVILPSAEAPTCSWLVAMLDLRISVCWPSIMWAYSWQSSKRL
jgi:hypothetical protein